MSVAATLMWNRPSEMSNLMHTALQDTGAQMTDIMWIAFVADGVCAPDPIAYEPDVFQHSTDRKYCVGNDFYLIYGTFYVKYR